MQKTFNPLFAADTGAGYKLSNEVKTATPSLLDAAQIGVCVYENPELSALPDKDAILVTSFGTTYKESASSMIPFVYLPPARAEKPNLPLPPILLLNALKRMKA